MKGAGVGGGEAANDLRPPRPSGIRDTVEPKSLPFALICDIHFWLTDPKIFLKTPLSLKYTIFEEDCAKKNAIYWSKFPKPKSAFFICFFLKNMAMA